ncbi:MAG: twin-arginine translocation signal domain-containing protein [Dongiaceae bacterium]
MTQTTRREFLEATAIGAGGAALGMSEAARSTGESAVKDTGQGQR